jgi:hypothetical protein
MPTIAGEKKRDVRPRPKHLALTSLARLYQNFADIFLGGKHQREHVFETRTNHTVQAFDHNFFHFVKLDHPERGPKFKIAEEHELMLQHVDGFGQYSVDQWRAKALPTAFDVLNDPDCIVKGMKGESTATHCFLKWYGGGPSPYTVTLVKYQKGYFIPVTSFAVAEKRLRKMCACGVEAWKREA